MEDVSNMTGEKNMKRAPKTLILNEVQFNGKDGKFLFTHLVDHKKGEKTKRTEIGSSLEIVFLKIRRRIAGFKRGNKSLREFDINYKSTEHNTKEDMIYLFGAKEKGKAEDLYKKYQNDVHIERVVYGFLIRKDQPRELVRFIVKGSSLNSNRDTKAPTTVDFFNYIQNSPKDTHMYQYVTKVTPVKETNSLGDYYTMHFERGAKLPQDKLQVAIDEIKKLHAYSTEQDAFYQEAAPAQVEEPKEKVPEIEYPEEDIDPNDIPF